MEFLVGTAVESCRKSKPAPVPVKLSRAGCYTARSASAMLRRVAASAGTSAPASPISGPRTGKLQIEPDPRRTNSLRPGCFCSSRMVRQTRVEFRPSNSEGSRGFKFAPLRHTVWYVSLHYGEAMKSARGARLTRSGGRGECHRLRLMAKIDQNSLLAILACPSADQPTLRGEASSGRTPNASNCARGESIGVPELAAARSRAGAVRFSGSLRWC